MLEFKNLVLVSRFPVQSDYWACIRQCKINRTCSISLALRPWAAFNLKCVNVKWSTNAAPELCEASSAALFSPAGPPASPASSSFSLGKAVAGSTRGRWCAALHPEVPRPLLYEPSSPALRCHCHPRRGTAALEHRRRLVWRGRTNTKHRKVLHGCDRKSFHGVSTL